MSRPGAPYSRAVGTSQVVVGCAADGGYALPLAVMLRSLAARLDPGHDVVVYAVDAGLGPDERDRVARSLGARTSLVWVEPERDAFAGLPLWGRMPITTYDKLAIARWTPPDVRRVLWLDADLLVLGDVAELWHADLGEAIAGAVQDARVPTIGARFGVRDWAAHGLARDAGYFNAGVLLIDLARWRAADVEGSALAYLREHARRVYFWDQEALNVSLAGRWRALPPVWNWSPTTGAGPRVPVVPAPRILHFSGNLKPWRYAGRQPEHALYHRTLDETAWSGFRPRRSLLASVLARYDASTLRRRVLPLERSALALLRAATFRYASPDELAVGRDGRRDEGRS